MVTFCLGQSYLRNISALKYLGRLRVQCLHEGSRDTKYSTSAGTQHASAHALSLFLKYTSSSQIPPLEKKNYKNTSKKKDECHYFKLTPSPLTGANRLVFMLHLCGPRSTLFCHKATKNETNSSLARTLSAYHRLLCN